MGTERGPRLRRGPAPAGRRRAAIAAATAAALLAAGWVALQVGGSGGGQTGAAPAAAGGTGKVERRTLAERLTATGTIGYAGETSVLARLAGTVTALPGVGERIERGEQLYALDGEPVLLMYGGVPAYRELAEGVGDGADVEQLEENLAALGCEPGTVDEEFTSTTAAAVSAWQEDAGLEVTGEVELGRIAFAPGPQRVTELEATLGEAIGSGGGGGASVAAHAERSTTTLVAYEVGAAEEAPEGEAPEGKSTKPDAEEEEQQEQKEPKERRQAPPGAPAEESSAPSGAGSETEAAEPPSVPVLKTSSTRRVVGVELDPDQQSVAWRGQRVEVLLPGDEEARGEVRRIAATDVGGEAPGEEPEPGVEVTVSLLGRTKVPALEGAAVSVLFIQNVREGVLSVPLTALIAIGGERFAVVAIEGPARRRIVVTPGLAADGYVEVEGKGLRAGMTVETGG